MNAAVILRHLLLKVFFLTCIICIFNILTVINVFVLRCFIFPLKEVFLFFFCGNVNSIGEVLSVFKFFI